MLQPWHILADKVWIWVCSSSLSRPQRGQGSKVRAHQGAHVCSSLSLCGPKGEISVWNLRVVPNTSSSTRTYWGDDSWCWRWSEQRSPNHVWELLCIIVFSVLNLRVSYMVVANGNSEWWICWTVSDVWAGQLWHRGAAGNTDLSEHLLLTKSITRCEYLTCVPPGGLFFIGLRLLSVFQ